MLCATLKWPTTAMPWEGNNIIEEAIFNETLSFFKCEYQFIGKGIEKGEPKDYDSKTRETKGNKMDYLEQKGKNKVKWVELKI